MHAPAGQLLYSGADLRCRRGALGLPEQDAAVLLGAPVGALRAWEADTGPVPELTAVLARMADVERVADRITGELVEEARRSGRIVTFRTDAGAMQAGAAMGVSVLHRICAGRAWEERNDAQLVFADARPVDSGGPDRRAELMVRIAMLALTRADIQERLGVGHRRVQQWVRGDAAIPAGVFEDLDVLEAAADRHTEALEQASAGGWVDVAATADDLAATYPGADRVPLSTHWAAAGVLLADDDRLRGRWVGAPAGRAR